MVHSLSLDIKYRLQEIFGPVLTVYVYDDKDADRMLEAVKDATPYGLTGAVFSQDKCGRLSNMTH